MKTEPCPRLWALLALFALAGGCAGTETGNPQTVDTNVSLELAPLPTIIAPPSIESGWLAVDAVAFEPASACGDATAAVAALPEPGAADLDGAASLSMSLPPGDYCGLHVALAPASAPLPEGAPAELEGLSLRITGKWSDKTPFVIASAADLDAALTAPGEPFPLTSESAPVVLSFDFEALVAGSGFYALEPGSDGTVHVDAATHADVLAAIEANLPKALALFRDVDGDGSISTGERAEGPLAAAP